MLNRNLIKEIHITESSSAKNYYDFASNMPDDAHELINRKALHERLRDKIFFYQSIILSKYGVSNHRISPLFSVCTSLQDKKRVHAKRNSVFPLVPLLDLYYWYNFWYSMAIPIHQRSTRIKGLLLNIPNLVCTIIHLERKAEKTAKATCLPFKKLKGQGSLNPFFNPHTIYFFHRHVQVNNKAGKIHVLPTLIHHNDYHRGVQLDFNINDNKAHGNFQTHAFRLNSAKQTFPIPFLPNWTYYPIDY
ncbi:unnamed protein product [Brassica oleracea]|uniref:Uncharacterized protein n=1 Tax=Brassica oleracea TaxID=3712 RepID=A0A3P6C1Q1_BRAOL|nr:unnamed protein product [Brassica oleracea]